MGGRFCYGKGLQVTSQNRFPPGTRTQFAPSLPCGDWQGIRFGSESVAVNTQLCLSASEDFDFHLTAQHTGVSGRQGRAWVWGEGGPGSGGRECQVWGEGGRARGGREQLCRALLDPCVSACWGLSHRCEFPLSGTPWGGCFGLLLVDKLNHQLQQLGKVSPPSKKVTGSRAEFLKNDDL